MLDPNRGPVLDVRWHYPEPVAFQWFEAPAKEAGDITVAVTTMSSASESSLVCWLLLMFLYSEVDGGTRFPETMCWAIFWYQTFGMPAVKVGLKKPP